jgi:hypothetical protein
MKLILVSDEAESDISFEGIRVLASILFVVTL